MLRGVYPATRQDGTAYFRASITYKTKHISLGSFDSEEKAHRAYLEAESVLSSPDQPVESAFHYDGLLAFKKLITLYNFRDNHVYIKTPIYLRTNYFSYYIDSHTELKFDVEDLFYYSNHSIMKRGNHLFVNDYGMQVSILSRYGIQAYAVAGKDYDFLNGDPTDLRYSNLEIHNIYHGVLPQETPKGTMYRAQIHLNGYLKVGIYKSPEEAAIAYNKAIDLAKSAGYERNFPENYLDGFSPRDYADLYTAISISDSYISYLEGSSTSH